MNFNDLWKDNGKIIAPWRNNVFGPDEFKRLQLLLQWCYNTCKDIDSTENFNKWPDGIRLHVAEALDEITKFNRNHNA